MALLHSLSTSPIGGRVCTLTMLAAVLVTAGGCITERVPVRPWLAGGEPSPSEPPSAPAGAGSTVPGTPAPIPARVSSGRARLSIEPLGTIAYDGLTLPVISPGGMWVASQVGQLAGSDVESMGERAGSVIIAPVGRNAQPRVIERAMLNRSATSRGVLVRLPREPDASNEVSRGGHDLALAAWTDGELTPLASVVDRAEHAIILRDGTLVTLGGDGTDQHLLLEKTPLGGSQARVEIPSRELAWPLATPDQRFIGVLAWRADSGDASQEPPGQMELVIVAAPGAATATPSIVRRVPLSLSGGAASAQAVTSPIDATPGASVAGGWESSFVLLHTGLRRVVVIDAATGRTAQLAPGSIAAALMSGGVFIAERDRLMWQPTLAGRAWPALDAATRAIEKPCIPRATASDEAILIAPGAATDVTLQLLRIRIGDRTVLTPMFDRP